jgi:hypothetical protein
VCVVPFPAGGRGDLLARYQAVLDYPTMSLFLKKDTGKRSILLANPKRQTL